MRLRYVRFACFVLPLSLTACGDEPPIYPPIVIVQVVGSQGGNGVGATGNSPSQGGSSTQGGSGGSSGSSSSTAGSSSNGDPLFAHCSPFAAAPPPPVQTACDLDALTDGGELKGDITADRTLESGKYYTMKGIVRVMQGKKLTIEPCVKILGENRDAALVVRSSAIGNPDRVCSYSSGTVVPGGQLIAVGEPMAPIVFTSANPPGQRAPGDWGGVLILGNAHHNLAKEKNQVPIEGLESAECHGYYTREFDEESSGRLQYVRIEYASRQVSVDLETNGLTFGSVGSGTVVDHVMVSNSADDCFEWFGGTVSATHLIALNCDDDMFDADNGHSGKLQFLFGRQFTTNTEENSRGFEISKGSNVATATETTVGISNFTLCGGGPAGDKTRTRVGMAFDFSGSVAVQNGFVAGFSSGGYQLGTGAATPPSVTHTNIFETMPIALANSTFLGLPGNSAEGPDRFCDCWANPPAPVAATPIEGASAAGYPDADATYRGAFASSSPESNWMTGAWVSWDFK
jgi:hypothetical protein